MSHEAVILEDGDTLYVGVISDIGGYEEVRLANVRGTFLVTDTTGSRVLEPPKSSACPQCSHYWKTPVEEENCAVGIGGGELCDCPGNFHHE